MNLQAILRQLPGAVSCVLLTILPQAACAAEQWGLFEATFPGPTAANPYLDVQLSARFTQKNHVINVTGFWDGENTYKIRFMPPSTGRWQFKTQSNSPELDGRTGSFDATSPSPANHGPMRVHETFYLAYADGTLYHQFGTTCYAWIHQPQPLQEQTLQTLAKSPFNKIRFCIFPKSYSYNKNEPELFAFQRRPDGSFDFSRPDPRFWRHLERRIGDLQSLGIEADLIVWHPYDRWGFSKMSDAEDDRYLRYCIARLAAFRNVWWSLANEFDFMTNQPKNRPGNKQMNDWDRFFRILQKEDPFQRLRGIHNGRLWYDHTRPWVTHASLQTSHMAGGLEYRNKFRKPILFDECKYEGNIPMGWGNISAETMTQRFWLGTLHGCYVGHGETYKHPQDILWWSKGGVLHGQSPPRIQWLKDLMAQLPPFPELEPQGDGQRLYRLAKPGQFYLVYAVDPQPQTIKLAGTRPYKVDIIDPWQMSVQPFGTAQPGSFTLHPPRPDLAFRFTPYKPGEKLRPTATILASTNAGIAPLTISLRSDADAQAKWKFSDGSTATGRTVTHTFTKPGLHKVTLEITDSDGLRAVNYLQIAADRDTSDPIVRAGFDQGETPPLAFHGTAKRGRNGTLLLPKGAPWGRATSGKGALDDLRGLRSFTVTGWLKPENLQIGSGGNRIIFCLNRNHSGIDLVCHQDGRLRLAVNQWPDRVRNDSSPGKLQLGKWTFFAVTYDSTQSGNNVSWHFSKPQANPRQTQVTLDRRTTHKAGPVAADLGPLAIGNFNNTMRSYGFDRQFRGQIRALQIFGSRIGPQGALPLTEIQKKLHP